MEVVMRSEDPIQRTLKIVFILNRLKKFDCNYNIISIFGKTNKTSKEQQLSIEPLQRMKLTSNLSCSVRNSSF
jgi:hypothetical protein